MFYKRKINTHVNAFSLFEGEHHISLHFVRISYR